VCRTVVMLQTMRVRLAAEAMIISGLVGVPDTMIIVIMVRSMIMQSMAIVMVADRARRSLLRPLARVAALSPPPDASTACRLPNWQMLVPGRLAVP